LARILIVGGGCRGRSLAAELVAEGHALRITTRDEAGRAAIEAVGAECWIGNPDVVGSLRYALENVTVLCWLLGSARGAPHELAALHGPRLRMMLSNTIDSTVRGVVYEAAGSVDEGVLAGGARVVQAARRSWEIPCAVLAADPASASDWAREARSAITGLLGRPPGVGQKGAATLPL
jgi:hypothetical protein